MANGRCLESTRALCDSERDGVCIYQHKKRLGERVITSRSALQPRAALGPGSKSGDQAEDFCATRSSSSL